MSKTRFTIVMLLLLGGLIIAGWPRPAKFTRMPASSVTVNSKTGEFYGLK